MEYNITMVYDAESNRYDFWISNREKYPLLLELREILEEKYHGFLKSFSIIMRVVEDENMIYASIGGIDHSWEKHYKKLTGGALFMLIHSMADYIDAVEWTEEFCSRKDITNK